MKSILRVTALLLAAGCALLHSGCVSSAERAPAAANLGFKLSSESKVAAVSIAISPEGKEKLKDNLKFDQEALRKQVERALIGYGVFAADGAGHLPTVEILVTDMRVRSNFSAVMWGFMAGADSIHGTVIIKDPTGKELDRFAVNASYALGGLAGGQDSARLDWLYEAFAKETLKELTGDKNAGGKK